MRFPCPFRAAMIFSAHRNPGRRGVPLALGCYVPTFQAGVFVVLRVLRGDNNATHGVTALPFFPSLRAGTPAKQQFRALVLQPTILRGQKTPHNPSER